MEVGRRKGTKEITKDGSKGWWRIKRDRWKKDDEMEEKIEGWKEMEEREEKRGGRW